MPDEQNDELQNYEHQMEQHEFIKRQGIEAWTDAIAGMMPHMDEDKRILVKEGLKAMLGGPPMPGLLRMPPREVDAEFVPPPPPPSPYFAFTDAAGTILYDWNAVASIATHVHRSLDGSIALMSGIDAVMYLDGESAEPKPQEDTIQ